MLPVVVGEKVAVIVQVAPPARVAPQVLVCPNWPLATIEIDVEVPPVFLTVTTLPALIVPTACAANVSLAGVTVRVTVVAFPVPVRVTFCGEFDALSVIVTAPVRVPATVGVKVTVTVQVAPAFKVAGQLFVCAKSPVDAIVSGVATVPVSFTVTVLPALVVPTACAANVNVVGVAVTVTVPAFPVPVRFTV
jgi:hypothetical protein